ncbi:hypothetical protein ACOMHN_031118 [Nucella lapillus]
MYPSVWNPGMATYYRQWGPLLLLLVLMLLVGQKMAVAVGDGTNSNQKEAEEFLTMFNKEYQAVYTRTVQIYYNYNINITAHNQKATTDAVLQWYLAKQNMSRLAAQFNTTNFPPLMTRQLFKIKDIGVAALKDASKLKRLTELPANMQTIFSTAKVPLDGKNLTLSPDIGTIFKTSRNESLLRYLWSAWRDVSGKKMRQIFKEFVGLSNEAMRTLGYADTGAYWRSWYEAPTFEQDVASLFEEMKPFYRELHAFVRQRLKKQYGEGVFPSSGHIPAHLLGNIWAQGWSNLQDLMMPYPNKTALDVTPNMVKQNYTVRKLFETADEFFTSLGLEPMPKAFWDDSMFEKPKDGREVVCHASAWDYRNGVDFRVKMCTEVNEGYFYVIHHEMGHIEYYLLYKNQPIVFKDGANPGFHEAVGDTIALSVTTPKHLHQIGLLPDLQQDKALNVERCFLSILPPAFASEMDLNFLMTMALSKIAFLPFGYLIDQWRWSVFRGDVTDQNYNKAWWKLRCNLQGVSPPVQRSEDDFDPGCKFHIPTNMPYIRYFVSTVVQFQFHKALCKAAGHQGPLHTCDIYNSTTAGDKLRAMLSKGSSEVWTVPFKTLTGQTKMSVQPLIHYFQPLLDYLRRENLANNATVGWSQGCP